MNVTCAVCGAKSNAWLCRPCLGELERAIGDLNSLRHELSILATRQTHIYRTNGPAEQDLDDAELDEEQMWRAKRIPAHLRSRDARTTLPATSLMVNLGARSVLDETDNLIITWARHLHETRDARWVRTYEGPMHTEQPHRAFVLHLDGEPPDSMTDLLAWLLNNVETVRFDEAAADMHHQFTDLHRRIVRAVDRSPSRVYAGPCDAEMLGDARCKRPLYAWPPQRFDSEAERTRWLEENPIVCDGYRPPFDRSANYRLDDTGCGATHTRGDRREWMLADLEDRLLPLSLLLDTLPMLLRNELTAEPPRKVMQAWVQQGRLLPKTVIDGVEFFRGGDMVSLMIRYRPHKYAPRQRRSA